MPSRPHQPKILTATGDSMVPPLRFGTSNTAETPPPLVLKLYNLIGRALAEFKDGSGDCIANLCGLENYRSNVEQIQNLAKLILQTFDGQQRDENEDGWPEIVTYIWRIVQQNRLLRTSGHKNWQMKWIGKKDLIQEYLPKTAHKTITLERKCDAVLQLPRQDSRIHRLLGSADQLSLPLSPITDATTEPNGLVGIVMSIDRNIALAIEQIGVFHAAEFALDQERVRAAVNTQATRPEGYDDPDHESNFDSSPQEILPRIGAAFGGRGEMRLFLSWWLPHLHKDRHLRRLCFPYPFHFELHELTSLSRALHVLSRLLEWLDTEYLDLQLGLLRQAAHTTDDE